MRTVALLSLFLAMATAENARPRDVRINLVQFFIRNLKINPFNFLVLRKIVL